MGNKSTKLSIFGNNANGIKAKRDSLLNSLKNFGNPSCVLLQETKLRFPGTFKLPGYQIFEKIRKGQGGGLLTAIAENLSPVLVSTGSEEIEILVVQILVGKTKIRILNGYGPQETESKGKILSFWQQFEAEIIDAKENNCLVMIEIDANAKLGPSIIKNDMHSITENGSLLRDILKRQNLTCLNGDIRCKGSVTRHRRTINGDEKSIIDFIFVCDKLLPFFNHMIVDEKRENVLTKYASLTGGRMKSESDHNPLFAQFNLKFVNRWQFVRQEMFDFKNTDNMKKFIKLTEDNFELLNWRRNEAPQKSFKRFFDQLNNIFHRCFEKIRIRPKRFNTQGKNDDISVKLKELSDMEKVLNSGTSEAEIISAKIKKGQIESQIYELVAEKNAKIVSEQVTSLDSIDGKFNQISMWKVKSKICPRPRDPPTAKKDTDGNIVTAPFALKKLYLETYKSRLEHRKINERYQNIRDLKNELWELRLELLKDKSSSKWSLADLEKATKNLKNNQARDPNGMISEIFKSDNAGKDLKKAVLDLMNLVLETLQIPDQMKLADITSIFKNKNSRMDLANDRGIFLLSVLRKVLDKLVYNEKYPALDLAMSDSNIGARRNKNVRNHLFIVYGIINSVVKEGRGCVDIQIYDLVQAFDALWLQDCMNDMWDCLPESERNRKLALIYETNRANLVAVNTPVGLTERLNMPEIVQQGSGWGPMQCSVSIDKLGRHCTQYRKYQYKYKDKVDTVLLAMIDDLLGIAPCGLESLALNTFINVQIEMKKLRFHTPGPEGKSKCQKIHVGRPNEFCPTLYVHGTIMKTATSDTYLGDVVSGDGTNKLNIANRVSRGQGKIAEIISLIENISLGKHYFKIALLLRESIFLNSILTNSEVWYRLTKSEIEDLEMVDRSLLKRILSVPNSTPTAALYLETGCIRIGTILKGRRVNFLHYLVKLGKSEMLSRFFYCQWYNSNPQDWTTQVKLDLQELNLPNDLDIIETKTKFSWKNLVKRKIKEFEFNELIRMKETQNKSKLGNLNYDELQQQEYFSSLNVTHSKEVFRFRTRMAKFSENYKEGGHVKACPMCEQHDDTQIMSFECPKVTEKIEIRSDYEEIFKSKITPSLASTLTRIMKLRELQENNLVQ